MKEWNVPEGWFTQVVWTFKTSPKHVLGKEETKLHGARDGSLSGEEGTQEAWPRREIPLFPRAAPKPRATRKGGREQALEPAPRDGHPAGAAAKAGPPPAAASPSRRPP